MDADSTEIENDPMQDYKFIDNMKLLQAVLSHRMPPEHLNPIINLVYSLRPSSKESEMKTVQVN